MWLLNESWWSKDVSQVLLENLLPRVFNSIVIADADADDDDDDDDDVTS